MLYCEFFPQKKTPQCARWEDKVGPIVRGRQMSSFGKKLVTTLPETNVAPENRPPQ